MLDLNYTSNIQGRELCRRDFMKYMCNFVVCPDTFEQFCFKPWYGAKHYCTLQSDSSLNELDVHSRSQDCGLFVCWLLNVPATG